VSIASGFSSKDQSRGILKLDRELKQTVYSESHPARPFEHRPGSCPQRFNWIQAKQEALQSCYSAVCCSALLLRKMRNCSVGLSSATPA
jgi:hypothetical protein